MKILKRTYLPDEIESDGKTYIQDYSFNEHSKLKPENIQVSVLSESLKGKTDLQGNVYKPRLFVFIEVKTPLDIIVRPLSGKRGAPMGRSDNGTRPTDDTTVFDCYLPMSDEAYDKGGAYWGVGSRMRVSYTKDLSYIEYYRELIAVA